MSEAAHVVRAHSGLPDYDRASWRCLPRLTHVVPLASGLGFLQQHASGAPADNEVDVPPARAPILLIWRKGARRLRFRVDGPLESRALRPGESVLLPLGASSWWISDDASNDGLIHLHFDADALARTASDAGWPAPAELHLPVGCRLAEFDPLVEAMLLEAGRTGGPSLLAWQSYAVLAQLALLRRQYDVPGPVRPTGGLAPWQQRRVCEHLEDRLAEDVSLAELGALVNLSTYHLCRAFKQSTGLPPHRWRHQRRMERARQLLEGTTLPVIEVAAAVGYDNPGQLAVAFRKAFGTSPSQYRRERRT